MCLFLAVLGLLLHELSPAVECGVHSPAVVTGFSLWQLPLFQNTGSRCGCSAVVELYSSFSAAACGILLWPRDRTRIPCTDRWIPIHCATRETLDLDFDLI